MSVIPSISDLMGAHWNQPSRHDILLDDEHALMTVTTFDQLAEYNCSMPSGVYPGKMWRVDFSVYHDDRAKAGLHRLWLRWYGESAMPGFVHELPEENPDRLALSMVRMSHF